MKLGVPQESFSGENRVSIVPAVVPQLVKLGCEVLVERGAGIAAGFRDEDYASKGATICDRSACCEADIVAQIRAVGANKNCGDTFQKGQNVIAMCDPLGEPDAVRQFAETGASLFSLEMIPRITRAQSMDVLSSMATVAGYRAVLLAATELPKMFPLMMTAAGTITPARVFVIGAGVAGLQAIATAKRLGAVVQAYDVRPAVREQVESLGGKFVELQLDTGAAEDKGGYAKAMGEEFYTKQREFMAEIASENDVVISTAAIPGKQSPLLLTADAVKGMGQGSVIVDLAAERGGNCELSKANEKVVEHGVTILGPTNLPGEIPKDASQMFAKNVVTFLSNMMADGKLNIDLDDEIVAGTLMAHEGEVTNGRVRDLLGMEPLPDPAEKEETIPFDDEDEAKEETDAADADSKSEDT
jgi:NAD(P) transhydrogenase subunit alpha